jgi:hypothetical protein
MSCPTSPFRPRAHPGSRSLACRRTSATASMRHSAPRAGGTRRAGKTRPAGRTRLVDRMRPAAGNRAEQSTAAARGTAVAQNVAERDGTQCAHAWCGRRHDETLLKRGKQKRRQPGREEPARQATGGTQRTRASQILTSTPPFPAGPQRRPASAARKMFRCGENKTRCGGAKTLSGNFRADSVTKENQSRRIAAANINCNFEAGSQEGT